MCSKSRKKAKRKASLWHWQKSTNRKKHKFLFDGLEIAYEEVGSDTPLQKRENIFNDEVIKLDKEKDVRMQPSRALFREDQLCEQLKVPH